jgi:hypothetical protein
MKTNSLRHTLAALPLLALAACGTASSRPTPEQPAYLAMARPTSDTPTRDLHVAAGARQAISDDVLHDPAQRFALMERLRTEVVAETRKVPEPRWRDEMRPALRLQLERAGLARADVDFLLWEIDQAKHASPR